MSLTWSETLDVRKNPQGELTCQTTNMTMTTPWTWRLTIVVTEVCGNANLEKEMVLWTATLYVDD